MSIYTKTGDKGVTSLYSGERVSKSSERVEAYGDADELQASLGFARSLVDDAQADDDLLRIEELLVDAMAELATLEGDSRITDADVAWIEGRIDVYSPDKFSFKQPGADQVSAALHVARTVARRCERRVIVLDSASPLSDNLLAFFNRISDFCYALACHLEQEK